MRDCSLITDKLMSEFSDGDFTNLHPELIVYMDADDLRTVLGLLLEHYNRVSDAYDELVDDHMSLCELFVKHDELLKTYVHISELQDTILNKVGIK